MKKWLSIVLAALLATATLTGCTAAPKPAGGSEPAPTEQSEASTTTTTRASEQTTTTEGAQMKIFAPEGTDVLDIRPVIDQRLSSLDYKDYFTPEDWAVAYSYYVVGDQWGLMDGSGNILLTPDKVPEWCSICHGFTIGNMEDSPVYGGEDFKIIKEFHAHCYASQYYYDADSKKFMWRNGGVDRATAAERTAAGVRAPGCVRAGRYIPDSTDPSLDDIVELDTAVMVGDGWKVLTEPVLQDGTPFADGIAAIKKDGKWGFLRSDGTELLPCQYEDACNFYKGTAAVKKDGKWGYIDQEGRELTDFVYEEARTVIDGKAWVKMDGKWGQMTFRF
ncbi:MAG: WG repeat-containing protein [Clostridiales bacterium]|nr:WG repeat-containing protein [Clostridiales bacterium]